MKKILLLVGIITSGLVGTSLAQEQNQSQSQSQPQIQTQPQQDAPSRQGRKHPSRDPQAMTERLAQDVSLSADQRAKVLALFTDSKQKREAARANNAGDQQAMQQTNRAIRQNEEAQLKLILTSDQWAKFLQFREENRMKRGQGGPQGAPQGQ